MKRLYSKLPPGTWRWVRFWLRKLGREQARRDQALAHERVGDDARPVAARARRAGIREAMGAHVLSQPAWRITLRQGKKVRRYVVTEMIEVGDVCKAKGPQ